MKSLIITGLLLCWIGSAWSQKTERRMISDFDEVSVVGNFYVEFREGEKPSLEIDADDIEMENIITTVEARELRLRLKPGFYKDAEMRIVVTYTEIDRIKAHAAAELFFADPVTAEKLEVSVGSAAMVDLQVNVESIELRVGEGSELLITGKCEYLDAKVATGGQLLASDLIASEVYAKINTGGEAEVHATDLIEASVGTGGNMTLYGNPKREDIHTSLGGNVRRLGT